MKLKIWSSGLLFLLFTLLISFPAFASPPIDIIDSSVIEKSPVQLKITKPDALREAAVATVKNDADPAIEARVNDAYGKLPLYFIKNDGQLDKKVDYYVKGAGYTIYFTT